MTEVIAGCDGKASDNFLHILMGVGNESGVVSEHEFADKGGLQSASEVIHTE